jgi:thioredoxin 1
MLVLLSVQSAGRTRLHKGSNLMMERAIIALAFLVIGFAVCRTITRRQLRKAAVNVFTDPLLYEVAPGIPTIVYFTTPDCAPCRLQQTPYLQKLQSELGENGVKIIRVDAAEHPDTATRWGVFSVPTTFVLNELGQPRNVHNGVVDPDTLKRELLA